MRCAFAAAASAAVTLVGVAQADVVAYWNFNSLLPNPNTAHGIVADQGLGMIHADGTNGSSYWASTASNPQLTAYAGFADNAIGGASAGSALGLANSASNSAGNANGFSIVVSVDLSNFESVSLSYASRASGSGFGFSQHAWAFSTDGVNFTSITSFTGMNAATVQVKNLGAVAALDHQATAFFRLTVSGATASNGHNRIDNLVVEGTYAATPAPGAAALVGLAGLMTRRRRG